MLRYARWESSHEIPLCTFIKDCTFIRETRVPTQYSFVLASKNTSKMKLYLLLYFLVQTNAFRVPLPYGTGVAYSGLGPGNEGIFDLIRTWFADENSVQTVQGNDLKINCSYFMSK